MHSSCAMTASSVTPPVEEEEVAEMDGKEGAGGVIVSVRGCFG